MLPVVETASGLHGTSCMIHDSFIALFKLAVASLCSFVDIIAPGGEEGGGEVRPLRRRQEVTETAMRWLVVLVLALSLRVLYVSGGVAVPIADTAISSAGAASGVLRLRGLQRQITDIVSQNALEYIIIIDAGSSGSRVHVHSYMKKQPMPLIRPSVTKKITPGWVRVCAHSLLACWLACCCCLALHGGRSGRSVLVRAQAFGGRRIAARPSEVRDGERTGVQVVLHSAAPQSHGRSPIHSAGGRRARARALSRGHPHVPLSLPQRVGPNHRWTGRGHLRMDQRELPRGIPQRPQ